MSKQNPTYYQDVEKMVDDIIAKVGKKIIFGMPLAMGKPNQVCNEIYKRAKEDSSIDLKIITALSLERPGFSSELERRFMQPFVERVFGDYCDLQYTIDIRKKQLPPNVEIQEFYMKPGSFLNIPEIQQNYINSNYTHAARDSFANGINVCGQIVSKEEIDGRTMYSMSCNPEVSIDLVPMMREAEKQGRKIFILGQVNQNLPFMYGDAVVGPETYDGILDNPAYYTKLFGVPKMSITDSDFMIGLHASSVIKDGGTLQIGIGSLGDALCYGLITRNKNNDDYQSIFKDTGILDRFGPVIAEAGGLEPFEEGLYGSTEMLVDGYMHLYENGVIKRKAYDNEVIQTLINKGLIEEKVTGKTLETLIKTKAIRPVLNEANFKFLQTFGILKPELNFEDGVIKNGGSEYSADLNDQSNFNAIVDNCLGTELKGGIIINAGFYLGPTAFYEALRNMPPEERKLINMTSVYNTNQLYGNEALKVLQRKHGRFVNATIMVTLAGSCCSDGLENGQVVSGVGGQYNFVAMAHALPGARSILMAKATRTKGKDVSSNIVYNYGHLTIPRHLRDIIITEYGIANLRSKADKDVIKELIQIADSRFQEELVQQAKERGKLPMSYQIPDQYRNNYPERIRDDLAAYKKKGLFPPFPFGNDFTKEELVIGKALRGLKEKMSEGLSKVSSLGKAMTIMSVPESAKPYLERLQLDKPANSKEKMMQKLVIYALSQSGAI